MLTTLPRVALRTRSLLPRNAPPALLQPEYLLRPGIMPFADLHTNLGTCPHCCRKYKSDFSALKAEYKNEHNHENGNARRKGQEHEDEGRQIDKKKIGTKNGTDGDDPRVSDLGRAIEDDFKTIREKYATPKHPIVLAHGLMGFDELRLAGSYFPGVQYWRGITEALKANGNEVIIATVPPSASIENRALRLGECIAEKAAGKKVNIIAHSMGGLDARYMISRLKPENVEVLSLTTISSPHRGSAFADFVLDQIGPIFSPSFWQNLDSMGISTGAFIQLTRQYMREEFNPNTPDDPNVRYFSYGARFTPSVWSAFRQPGRIVSAEEGANDGLVSVDSARWGTYKGTLVQVSHLDLINWTSRLKWWFGRMSGNERKFNAIAFYLDITDMLSKEGL